MVIEPAEERDAEVKGRCSPPPIGLPQHSGDFLVIRWLQTAEAATNEGFLQHCQLMQAHNRGCK